MTVKLSEMFTDTLNYGKVINNHLCINLSTVVGRVKELVHLWRKLKKHVDCLVSGKILTFAAFVTKQINR